MLILFNFRDDQNTLHTAYVENAESVTRIFNGRNPKEILQREERLVLRAASVYNAIDNVDISADIDGISIIFDKLTQLRMDISEIQYNGPLFDITAQVRKHLPRVSTKGIKLASEKGYNLYLMSSNLDIPKLKESIVSSMGRPVIRKQGLHTLVSGNPHDGKLRVYPKETAPVLSTMQDAIEKLITDPGNPIKFLLCSFGQKQSEVLKITDLLEVDPGTSIAVHPAVQITNPEMTLLWSRDGLQDLVGTRGSLYPCLSLSQAANFQSNLDGRALTIHQSLRGVATFPDKVTFVQLYATSPHRKVKREPHPVSGNIILSPVLGVQVGSYQS